MKYYYIWNQLSNEEAFMERETMPEDFMGTYSSDKPIHFEEGAVAFHHYKKDKQLTDLLGAGGYLVVSEKMRAVLAELEPKQLMFHPVPVHTTWNRKKVPYFLAHLLDDVDFVDKEASDYLLSSNGKRILKLRKLVLNKDNIGNRRIFRTQALPLEVFVSEDVKLAIEEAGLSGIGFHPAETFTKRVYD